MNAKGLRNRDDVNNSAMGGKLCPLIAPIFSPAGQLVSDNKCIGRACAWWDEGHTIDKVAGACIVFRALPIATALENILKA